MKKNILILSLVAIELLVVSFILFKKVPITVIKNELAEQPVGEITQDIKISQTVRHSKFNFDTMEIKFATYNRENSTNIHMVLYMNNKKMKETLLDSSKINDNEFYTFNLPNILLNENDVMRIDLYSDDATPGDALTLWTSNGDALDGELSKNGEVMNGDLNVKFGREGYKFEQLVYMLNRLPVSIFISIPLIVILIVSLNLLIIQLVRKVKLLGS
ncbi:MULTISPECIES: hypothetical protein [Lysinibacillus]|uniref:hypothetical protein n=1 Tax=Lysinibacillus TaxID=400634 RepID=UPI0021A48257|nr:hypothetical protein [Lysinibacillus capsici]MCT1539294.1 hypothetical protein [Lysinibacillus capsici]MCT1570638.1 hypothetical protein [Lysinibacillus capsici]MCT1647454.1 hypothetical protein [Lysinibacillus capsici]MCT1726268.1 hypothetical protein [Lysinibacillus capsici]MCT1783372.1 hypothetical protein [Lysinibacillus capsici]